MQLNADTPTAPRQPSLQALFLEEAREQLTALRGAAALLTVPDAASGARLRLGRAAHLLKGTALTFEHRAVAEAAHALEACLQAPAGEVAGAIEALAAALDALEAPGAPATALPISTLYAALERAAHQAAEETGRRVRVILTGADLALPRSRCVALERCLVQLVRNAVSHGIEAPEERALAGKPAGGTVSVEFAQRGRWLEVRCRDDGRGISPARAYEAAQRAGLVPESLADRTPEASWRLVLSPGVSTAPSVSLLAGRGLGLDAVGAEVRAVGGRLTLATRPGRGLTVTLALPLEA